MPCDCFQTSDSVGKQTEKQLVNGKTYNVEQLKPLTNTFVSQRSRAVYSCWTFLAVTNLHTILHL